MLKFFINRRYTKFYGTQGDAAAKIAHDAILGEVQVQVCTLSVDNLFQPYKCGVDRKFEIKTNTYHSYVLSWAINFTYQKKSWAINSFVDLHKIIDAWEC